MQQFTIMAVQDNENYVCTVHQCNHSDSR